MAVQKIKPRTIEEYIDAAPPELQQRLWQLHEAIRNTAPGAIEGLKWKMPAYSYKKILVTWAVFKNHTGFFPMPSAIKALAKDLAGYSTTAAAVQFPHDKKLPLALVKKIVKFRVKESKEGTIRWRS